MKQLDFVFNVKNDGQTDDLTRFQGFRPHCELCECCLYWRLGASYHQSGSNSLVRSGEPSAP